MREGEDRIPGPDADQREGAEAIPGPAVPVPPKEPAKKPSLFRRMYDWVLSFAEKPGGGYALFGLSFAESSFFPIPPDPLLIALALGAPKRAFHYAAICTAGSVLGGMAGYAIGWGVWESVDSFFYSYVPGVSAEGFEHVRGLYVEYDFWAIFMAGFTPIPYKLFTISAGVFKIAFPVFVLASVLSRAARFFIVAGLIWKFGPPIKAFIDRYFDLLAWAFLILVVGGFAIMKFVL